MPHIDLILNAGQSEGIDEKVLPEGTLVEATNARLAKDGRYEKREGSAAHGLVLHAAGGSPIEQMRSLDRYQGQRLAFASPPSGDGAEPRVFSWDGSLWHQVGVAPAVSAPQRFPVRRDAPGKQHNPGVAYANGLVCYVFLALSSTGLGTWDGAAIFAQVVNAETGATVDFRILNTYGDINGPRVVACGDDFVVGWYQDNAASPASPFESWTFQFYDASANSWTDQGDLSLIFSASGLDHWDICAFDATSFLLVYRSSGTQQIIKRITASTGTAAATSSAFTAKNVPTIFYDGGAGAPVHVANYDKDTSSGAITLESFTTALVSSVGPTTIETSVGDSNTHPPVIGNLAVDSTAIVLAFDEAALEPDTPFVHVVEVARSNHATTSYNIRNMAIASKPFVSGVQTFLWLNSHTPTGTAGTNQDRTYHLVGFRAIGEFFRHAEIARDVAYKSSGVDGSFLSDIATDGDGRFFWAHYYNSDLPDLLKTQLIEFDTDPHFESVEVHNVRYFSGGFLGAFDGASYYQTGHPMRPLLGTITTPASGTSLGAGVYTFVVVFDYYDAQGNLLLSAPSDVATATTVAGDAIQVYFKDPFLDRYDNENPAVTGTTYVPPSFVRAFVYCSLVDGTVLYRDPSGGSVGTFIPWGDASTFLYTIDDSDSLRAVEPALYTQGVHGALSGPLANWTPPPCRHIWSDGKRLWTGGLERTNECRASKEAFPGEQIAFPEDPIAFSVFVAGAVQGGAALDGVNYAFTDSEIFAWYGDGPDDAGVGQFSQPRKLPSTVGLKTSRSLLEVPQGLLFQGTENGIYLLPRGGGAPNWVGQAVRDTLEAFPVVTATALWADRALGVIACTNSAGTDGRLLVLDLRNGQWYVDDVGGAVEGLTVWDDELVMMTSGAIVVTDASVHVNAIDASEVEMTLKTGQILPFGGTGWGLLQSIQVFGEYLADGQIEGAVRYFGDGDDGQSYTALGAHDITGLTAGDPFQREWWPARQKCAGCQIRLTVKKATGGSATAELALNKIRIQYQKARGAVRLPPAMRA